MGSKPAIIVHGGAGKIGPERREAALEGCRAAAGAGWAKLAAGGTAVEAVEAAVMALEDNPDFNAGTGAVLDAEGAVQLDASIMDGSRLAAGAVANVRRLRNPVALARQVMEDGRHVLLVSEGAEAFAQARGVPLCDNAELIVARQQARWEELHGTVGAVALDGSGRLAAATSTGGRMGSLPGRVGDSPLIGCGTYADARAGVSCTGIGEAIIRVVLAKTAADMLGQATPPMRAAQAAITLLAERTRAEAGLIMIDAQGRVGHAHNAETMAIAWIEADGRCQAML